MVYDYIQPVSESDVSKGKSSLSTPTNREVADNLNKSRSSSKSSRSKSSSGSSSSYVQPVSESNPDNVQSVAEPVVKSEKSEVSSSYVQPVQNNNRDVVRDQIIASQIRSQSVASSNDIKEKPPVYIAKEAQDRFRENPYANKVTIGEWTFTRAGKTESKEVPEFIGSNGMISEAEKPKGFLNKLSAKEDRLLSDVEKRDSKGQTSFVQGASLFGIGVVKGVVNLGMIFVRPDKFAKGLWSVGKESIKDPLYLPRSLGTSFAQNPSGFIGEVVGTLGVGKVVGTVAKAGVAKFKTPKIVGEGYGQTLKTEVSAGVIEGESASSTIIKSGSNKFKVDTKTQSVDRLDYADARLQSSKTDLTIGKLDNKGNVVSENTGFSRSETVASLTEDGTVLARGDTVQATNVGKSSITRQGDFVAIGEGSEAGTRMTTIASTGKGVKGSPVSSANELNFFDDASKKVSSVESSYSKKLLEYDAPQSKTFNTEVGKITVESGDPVKNTLYDDFTSARGGSYLSAEEKASKIKVDPYGQTTSQGGVSLSFKNFDDAVSPSPVNKVVAGDKALTSPNSVGGSLKLTANDEGLVLSAKTNVISQTPLNLPSSSAQALKAVEDVVNQGTIKTSSFIDSSSKVVPSVSVGVLVSQANSEPLPSVQYSNVKGATPVLVSKTQTISQDITPVIASKTQTISQVEAVAVQGIKSFSSTKVLTQQKNALEAVLDTRTRSKSKVALANATIQATDNIQKTQQKQVVAQLTAQKVGIRQAVLTPQVVPTQLLFSPIVKSTPSPVQNTVGGGFDVFVRTRGVFQKVNKRALGRSDAKDFGAYNVANTPQATFTLRPIYGQLGSVSSKVRGSFFAFQSNFQKKGSLFIEKRGKRIKSGGEKAGITRLGILANKKKGMFKGLKL